jgi:dTDP-glucose 4,6-dehydratase
VTTVLVTGGAGFLGRCLVGWLLRDSSCRVIVLDKLTYAGNVENLAEFAQHSRFQFVRGDIGDAALVSTLFESYHPEWVVNCAAESHVDRSIDAPLVCVATNVVGTCQLLEVYREYWRCCVAQQRAQLRFVQVSTDEVFGSLGPEGRFGADSPYAPRSPYAASKAGGDHFARAYYHTYGLPTIVTHCSNNYGPYQFPEKLIPLMIRCAWQGRPLPLYGDGSQVRDWIHVSDHARGLLQTLRLGQPGKTYCFGGGCECTNRDLVELICQELDKLSPRADGRSYREQITRVEDRPGHDSRYAIDSEATRRELQWKPETDFDTGMRETVRWFWEHRAWIRRVTDGTYDGRRLGTTPH